MKKAVAYLAILLATLLLSLFLYSKNNSPKINEKKVKREKFAELKEPETEWIQQTESVTPPVPPPFPFPVLDAETEPNPIPVEWEESLFDILDNSKSREERNSRLYLFAITTARNSPRVQEECLAHLAFGINNSEKEFAFEVLKDMRISDSARILMFKNMDTVRPDEFMYFLSSNLMKTLPSSELKQKVAQSLLEFQNANQK